MQGGRETAIIHGVKSRKLLGETIAVLALLFLLQFYFVRGLLAAELLFGLAFGVLLVLGVTVYLIGSVAERSLKSAGVGVRVIVGCARPGSSSPEEIGSELLAFKRRMGLLGHTCHIQAANSCRGVELSATDSILGILSRR